MNKHKKINIHHIVEFLYQRNNVTFSQIYVISEFVAPKMDFLMDIIVFMSHPVSINVTIMSPFVAILGLTLVLCITYGFYYFYLAQMVLQDKLIKQHEQEEDGMNMILPIISF